MTLQGKFALVTGGSRGIGRAIALKLAAEGAQVAVNYTKNKGAADEVVQQIIAQGGQAFAVQADIADLDSWDPMFAALEQVGRLDILVNNAGWGEFLPFDAVTVESFDQQFDLNVRGLFFVTQRALRLMNNGGRIINLSSVGARGLSIEGAAYAGTKAAVNAITSALSKGLGARGITVNSVSPGFVETDLSRAVFSPEDKERTAQRTPLKRIGQPDDIADVVAFLASDAGRWITGREIVADGGSI